MNVRIGVIGIPPGVTSCALDAECPNRGFAIDAARSVCGHLNLSCTYQWFGHTEYGDADVHGNGTGLVGAIQRNEYDTSAPVFTPTFSRFRAIDFSDIYFYFHVLFVTRRPTPQPPLLNWNMVNSFQWQTWCVFILSLLSTSLMINYVARLFAESGWSRSLLVNFLHLLTTCASLISLKGRQFRHADGRLTAERSFNLSKLLILWTFGGLVLTSAYTGMLFSQKVVSAVPPPFIDIESFVVCLESKKCRIIAHATSYSALQLLTAPGSALTERVQRAVKDTPILAEPLEKVPRAILDEQDVFLVWIWSESSIMYAIGGNADCEYYAVEAPYKEVYTFPLRKHSPLLRALNRMSDPFRENALAYGFRDKYKGSGACNEKWNSARLSGDAADTGATLRSLTTVFAVYGLGLLAAAFTLILEMSIRRL